MKNLMFKAVVVAVLLMTMVLGLVACKHNHKFVDGKCECGEIETPAFDAAAVRFPHGCAAHSPAPLDGCPGERPSGQGRFV